MASSSADGQSQPRRPPLMARQSSTSSQMSRSLSDSQHKPAPHKAQRQHVVGQGRVQRNSSGKDLKKLIKLTQTHGGDGNTTRHHRRNASGPSGTSNSAPSSPRPGFKRNASTGGVVRAAHQQHTHAAIRKNHSSGHLARHGHAKTALKTSRSEIAPPKRALAHASKARERSPDAHPTVHFDVGDNEGNDENDENDDGWTEASASQSPATTRSNTRSNSVVLEPQKTLGNAGGGSSTQQISQAQEDSHRTPQALPDRTRHTQYTTDESRHRSRPPDADMITSRLLRRTNSHISNPQMSSVTATVVSESHDAPVLVNQSISSTLVDTPGRDLVSRFMDAGSSAGTPKSSFLPSRNSPASAGGDFDQAKRNKSMPNFAEAGTPSKAQSQSRRSGTSTPTDLPPSRTQQKLLLQRASSSIEPQKLIPAILPRTGAPTGYVHPGVAFAANGEGRIDPRLQQQFNHVAVEYKVVRRYRNPLADAIVRIQQIPGVTLKSRVPSSRSARTNGTAHVHGSSSLSTSLNESSVETNTPTNRRSRTSFENGDSNRDHGDVEGRQSFGSENERIRNEAEELCRRLWESTEAVGDD